MMKVTKLWGVGLAVAAYVSTVSPARAVLVTFSGLNNGVNTATDPDDNRTGQPVPTNYQPLLNAYPAPGGNTDGGNIGVTITYGNVFGANTATNNGVNDHTHMVTASDTGNENVYDNGNATITMSFDKPVTIPSFYFTYFSSGTYTSTFMGFTNASDTTPVATFTAGNTGAYNWSQETQFGTTPLQKITFTQSSNFQQIDDMTINLAPEPASLGVLGVGALGLLARRRGGEMGRL